MSKTQAEASFKKGLAALVLGRSDEAADLFGEAIRTAQSGTGLRVDPRYLSYYGLSLAKSRRHNEMALRACRSAVDRAPTRPELLLNLGRVYLLAGKTTLALDCLQRGVKLAPQNRRLRIELDRVDRRSPPAIRRLDRSHALNRWAGRLRSMVTA